MDTIASTSFGELLRGLRKRQRLRQQDLAERLGLHRNTIGTWERGDYLPDSKAQVLELARQLDLDEQETRQLLEASLSALAPHWLVPRPRNPLFTGREAILAALHTRLGTDQQGGALARSAALCGLGGVGKTQVALEYAYRSALQYSAVFWIEAETEASILSSMLRIAEALRLSERDDQDQQRMLAAVQRWLSTHGQWLLIWDNLEELDALQRFLPPTRSGAILLTTRQQALGPFAQGLSLEPMGQEEGVLFLLRRAKVLELEAHSEQVQQLAVHTPAQHTAATALVDVLGGLPLALDQAGAYIEETGCSISGYLQRYNRQRAHLLARRGALAVEHPHSVTTTFTLAMAQVEQEQSAAAELLRVCAFLRVDAIPEEVFREGAAHLGPELELLVTDPLQFDSAIALLRRLSLVQCQPEARTFSLHRLVQDVLREQMEPASARQWSQRIMRLVNAAFPEAEFANWARCERCLTLALACVSLLPLAGGEMPEAGELFYKAGTYLVERAL